MLNETSSFSLAQHRAKSISDFAFVRRVKIAHAEMIKTRRGQFALNASLRLLPSTPNTMRANCKVGGRLNACVCVSSAFYGTAAVDAKEISHTTLGV